MKQLPFTQMQDDFRRDREIISNRIQSNRSENQKRHRDALMAQREAYDALPGSARQELDEMEIFCRFSKAARLDIEPGSTKNEQPRRPDISCRIAGQVVFFELGRIVDEKVAREVFYPTLRTGGMSVPTAYDPVGAFIRMVQSKANKKYDTDDSPVDLVLYYYEQSPELALMSKHLGQRAPEIGAMIQESQFRTLWIFDMWSTSVLWRTA
jgi:hypothetical protein